MTETVTWQPIETAPKDGDIMLWVADGVTPRACVGRWSTNEYAKRPRPYWSLGSLEYVMGINWARSNQPTHWAPLLKGPGK